MEEENNTLPIGVNRIAVIASKLGEIYKLLEHTVNYYMPPISHSDDDFVHDVILETKKVFKNDQIKTISVTCLKNLRISDIFPLTRRNCDDQKYLPDLKEKRIPQREYICNIVNTKRDFSEYVKLKVDEQEERYIAKRNMRMLILPEFKDLFEISTTISKFHGKFPGIVKGASKRCYEKERRAVDQNKFDQMELESIEKNEKILALETKLSDYSEETFKNDENVQRLSKLYELGIINERGEPIAKD